MSAAEIIELIKKLPPAERAEVVAYLLSLQAGTAAESRTDYAAGPTVSYIPEAEVERMATKLFADHHELFRRLAQ